MHIAHQGFIIHGVISEIWRTHWGTAHLLPWRERMGHHTLGVVWHCSSHVRHARMHLRHSNRSTSISPEEAVMPFELHSRASWAQIGKLGQAEQKLADAQHMHAQKLLSGRLAATSLQSCRQREPCMSFLQVIAAGLTNATNPRILRVSCPAANSTIGGRQSVCLLGSTIGRGAGELGC